VPTLFGKIVDNRQDESLATAMRRKRFALFERLLATVPLPLTILDVGGTENFWERMGFADRPGASITLLNIEVMPTRREQFQAIVGDATDMSIFRDKTFDVVFSNSVIEHVGDFEQQRRMAAEVRRVGHRYFLQTPNYYFPLEPHFLFPGFQWLPRDVRVALIRRFNLGWIKRIPEKAQAQALIDSTRLLRQRELRALFPQAGWYEEKLFGLTKSFVVYDGW
jgi:hypothetical protein